MRLYAPPFRSVSKGQRTIRRRLRSIDFRKLNFLVSETGVEPDSGPIAASNKEIPDRDWGTCSVGAADIFNSMATLVVPESSYRLARNADDA